MWLTAPKGTTPVNYTSATDWQMAARRDNVISITFLNSLLNFSGGKLNTSLVVLISEEIYSITKLFTRWFIHLSPL